MEGPEFTQITSEEEAQQVQIPVQDVIMTLIIRARSMAVEASEHSAEDEGRGYRLAVERLDEAALWVSTTYDVETMGGNPPTASPEAIWTPGTETESNGLVIVQDENQPEQPANETEGGDST